ncbi:N-acetylglucosamine-6-phosphate deacetylase [Aliiglaciecola sp. NS0011-25]|uniref:N-acetylglucosamine-6-phosphate deacetylase n=1 Tax=Aliiglaciecola sp. NS0011-25 TaxID=3127654 RepID=UPI003104CBCB
MTFYHASRLFDGQCIRDNVRLSVENGVIRGLDTNPQSTDLPLKGLVTAGFIDTQVNGGGGLMFNQQPSLTTIRKIRQAHSLFGTTAMLPTLITDNLAIMQQAADAIAEAIVLKEPGILGIHFEGPHLSIPKRGIHSSHEIRPLSEEEMAIFCRQDLGKVVVTVAPENVSAAQISELVSCGVIVSLGHSNADIDTVLQAIDAGASGFTHLFNAMSGLAARNPGMVAAALHDPRVTCGLIADELHVHPYNCRLAFQCKGWQNLMLVTDAMAHVGADVESLPWLDTHIIRTGNKLTLPDGTLAGSALDMASAVSNIHQNMGIALESALNMASLTPARFLYCSDRGKISVGMQADFVLLDDQLQSLGCWIAGVQVAALPAKV